MGHPGQSPQTKEVDKLGDVHYHTLRGQERDVRRGKLSSETAANIDGAGIPRTQSGWDECFELVLRKDRKTDFSSSISVISVIEG